MVFWRTFVHGVAPVWESLTTPEAKHAFWLTLTITAIAVPANTIFGVACAIAIVRHRFRGAGQEHAASTLGASSWATFRRVTLPAIRWGVAYGVVLTTARCLGEFGAVSVVSGRVVGQTETLTIHVEQSFQNFDVAGAYAASTLLAGIAIATLVLMSLFTPTAHA